MINAMIFIIAGLFAVLAIDTEAPGFIDRLSNVITGKNESEETR